MATPGSNMSIESHLLQMRGLKRLPSTIDARTLNVASFTDAWIETQHWLLFLPRIQVASFTDAWIETRYVNHLGNKESSHLLQMRGLKLESSNKRKRNSRSHLLQMRGLKRLCCSQIIQRGESHLLQMRGLKQKLSDLSYSPFQVASFTDAWIETCH